MSHHWSRVLYSFVPLVMIVGFVAIHVGGCSHGCGTASMPTAAFDGSSEQLEKTIIVPTLDTPMPEGKNVVWCASFQLAWDEMRDEIVGEPIRIANAEQLAARLNNAASSKENLDPDSFYVKAGAVADGVIEQIQKEMAARFPGVPVSESELSQQAVVAYAYLAANVKFTIPFPENSGTMRFANVPVTSFGLCEESRYTRDDLRAQIEILYADKDSDYDHGNEFALDPCRDSSPYQLILACVAPKETLAETVADLDAKIAGWEGSGNFSIGDVLLIPDVVWRIQHHFSALEGKDKIILNEDCPISGFWCSEAFQMIDFRLDRSGAALRSKARLAYKAHSRYFLLNRPFLIVMKKRDAAQPFFVMWVDNAELLCKEGSSD